MSPTIKSAYYVCINLPIQQHHDFLTTITEPRVDPFAQLAQFLQRHSRNARLQVEQSVVLGEKS